MQTSIYLKHKSLSIINCRVYKKFVIVWLKWCAFSPTFRGVTQSNIIINCAITTKQDNACAVLPTYVTYIQWLEHKSIYPHEYKKFITMVKWCAFSPNFRGVTQSKNLIVQFLQLHTEQDNGCAIIIMSNACTQTALKCTTLFLAQHSLLIINAKSLAPGLFVHN